MLGYFAYRLHLLHRLDLFRLSITPLRDRGADLLPLAASLMEGIAVRHRLSVRSISETGRRRLLGYGWPGNVRELENVVQRAVVLCSNNHIELSHLMFDDASEMLLSDDSSTLAPS